MQLGRYYEVVVVNAGEADYKQFVLDHEDRFHDTLKEAKDQAKR